MRLNRFASLAFAAALIFSGCVSTQLVRDTRQPDVVVDSLGNIFIHNRPVPLASLGYQAKSAGYERDEAIHIQMPEPQDRELRDKILLQLRRVGYTRVVFTTARKAYSRTTENGNPNQPPPSPYRQP